MKPIISYKMWITFKCAIPSKSKVLPLQTLIFVQKCINFRFYNYIIHTHTHIKFFSINNIQLIFRNLPSGILGSHYVLANFVPPKIFTGFVLQIRFSVTNSWISKIPYHKLFRKEQKWKQISSKWVPSSKMSISRKTKADKLFQVKESERCDNSAICDSGSENWYNFNKDNILDNNMKC